MESPFFIPVPSKSQCSGMAQMLLRFQQDVIALKPAVVVILAGTNDIAGNTGPTTQAMIEDNLHAMVELAQAHNIRIVLASVLPVSDYPWQPGVQPAGKVTALNRALRAYAEQQGLVYLDYHTAMTNKDGGLDPELAADGVHPTAAGYAKMVPLAEAAIARGDRQILRRRRAGKAGHMVLTVEKGGQGVGTPDGARNRNYLQWCQ